MVCPHIYAESFTTKYNNESKCKKKDHHYPERSVFMKEVRTQNL